MYGTMNIKKRPKSVSTI